MLVSLTAAAALTAPLNTDLGSQSNNRHSRSSSTTSFSTFVHLRATARLCLINNSRLAKAGTLCIILGTNLDLRPNCNGMLIAQHSTCASAKKATWTETVKLQCLDLHAHHAWRQHALSHPFDGPTWNLGPLCTWSLWTHWYTEVRPSLLCKLQGGARARPMPIGAAPFALQTYSGGKKTTVSRFAMEKTLQSHMMVSSS